MSSPSFSSLDSSLSRLFSETSRLLAAPAELPPASNFLAAFQNTAALSSPPRAFPAEPLARLHSLLVSFNDFKSSVLSNENSLSARLVALESQASTTTVTSGLSARMEKFEQEIKRIAELISTQDNRLSAIENRLAGVAVATASADRFHLFVRATGLPLVAGKNNLIAALFVQAGDKYCFVSKSDLVSDSETPIFEKALEFSVPAGAALPLLKLNLYDTTSNEVYDSDRIGSVLIRCEDLLDSAPSEVFFQLEHEDPEKAKRIASSTVVLECEKADNHNHHPIQDNDSPQAENRSLARSSVSSRILPGLKNSSTEFSFRVSCRNLPATKRPVLVAAYRQNAQGGWSLESESEALEDFEAPDFDRPLSVRVSSPERALMRFSVFEVDGSAEPLKEENRVGSVIVQLSDLIGSAEDEEVLFDLLHEKAEKQEILKQSAATIGLTQQQQAEQQESSEDDEGDGFSFSSSASRQGRLGGELKKRIA